MRYILDQAEMDALVPRTTLEAREAALLVAREALLKAAAFTCVYERQRGHGGRYDNYCDDCPALRIRHLCTLVKQVSK